MIVDYSGASPFASLEAQVLAGRNGGAWNGDGINSSTAAASSGTEAVGIADNSVLKLTSFDGMPVDQSSVLMKLTLAGDANLDGRVDNADLAALAAHWQGTSAVWTSGDFDYNGVVDIHDLLFMAINWGTSVSSASPISGSLPAALALMGLTGTSVPEPLGTAAVVLGLVAASRRQRRRR
jgi:hypothetical protein